MGSPRLRVVLVALGLVVTFAAVVAVMMQVLPGPLTQTDSLVVGAVATFVTMLALFLVLFTTWIRP